MSRQDAADGGAPGNDSSFDPSISADGRFVAFGSIGGNLIPGDGPDLNGFCDAGPGDDLVHHDAWFCYEAPCNGIVTIDTDGSGFDTSYEGKSVGPDKRSLTFRAKIGSNERTLVDQDLLDFRKSFEQHLTATGLEIKGGA